MKKFIPLAFLLSITAILLAQDEELNNLSFNPALYYSTKQYQPARHTHRYLVDKTNIIVTTDTLHLPFIDDFSTNRLRSYKWIENHITDTFYNVYGTCLGNEGIATINQTFSDVQAWNYTFDVTNIKVDSTPQSSVTLTFFGPSPSGCFAQTPQAQTKWNQYYTYHFDTATGKPVDSVLVTANTTAIDYAPVIYFATGEPGTLWFDNYAYVNNTYPINPPTIGVATLDGLNEFGLPYNNTSTTTYGTADYLTSLPINISTLSTDSNLFLSFFYEPKGMGDYPDLIDSLIVEFKDNSGAWRVMWSDTGYSSPVFVPDTFKQVFIKVPDLAPPYKYFHNTFQFRFRNKASLYGNNDHWHIDYVRFDKGRSDSITWIQDIAFVYPFPTILKNFTLMPADQFINPADLRDSLILTVHNLDSTAFSNPPATNFTQGAEELYPTAGIIANNTVQTFNAAYDNYLQVNPAAYSIPAVTVDSLVLLSTVFINPNDTRHQNDTLYHIQNFNSVMAYDDGSAERSYGISGLGKKKFAYEFNLNHPDTLAAFQVQYSQVDGDVSNLVFNFNAWDSLRLNDMSFDDTDPKFLKFSMDNKKPYYIDSVNGFTTYKLDTPIIVSNKIYFGWTQTDTRRLQIGYDLNSTLGRPHMFIFTNTTWKASTITPAGSPMIRLIFDSNFWGGNSAVSDIARDDNNITFFPNPTSGMIRIRSERSNVSLEISVMNMMGQRVKYENAVSNEMNIADLENGIYLLSARDTKTGKTYHSKIIKTAF